MNPVSRHCTEFVDGVQTRRPWRAERLVRCSRRADVARLATRRQSHQRHRNRAGRARHARCQTLWHARCQTLWPAPARLAVTAGVPRRRPPPQSHLARVPTGASAASPLPAVARHSDPIATGATGRCQAL